MRDQDVRRAEHYLELWAHRRYLHAVYRFPRECYEIILSRAMENVGKGLHKKGMP